MHFLWSPIHYKYIYEKLQRLTTPESCTGLHSLVHESNWNMQCRYLRHKLLTMWLYRNNNLEILSKNTNPQDREGNEELKILLENTQQTAQMIICQRCKLNLQHCCSRETFIERQLLAPQAAILIAEDLTKPHSRSILFRTFFTSILFYGTYAVFMQIKTSEFSDSRLDYWISFLLPTCPLPQIL